jgi:hypothetical protein
VNQWAPPEQEDRRPATKSHDNDSDTVLVKSETRGKESYEVESLNEPVN